MTQQQIITLLTSFLMVFTGIFLIFRFGIPYVSIRKIKVDLSDQDSLKMQELRKKHPELDIKCAIFNGLTSVKDTMIDIVENRDLYDKILFYTKTGELSKIIFSRSIQSFKDISKYFKKSHFWWKRKYAQCGYDRKKTIEKQMEKHIDNFNNLYELESFLKKIKVEIENRRKNDNN
jgi:hypothetical protein